MYSIECGSDTAIAKHRHRASQCSTTTSTGPTQEQSFSFWFGGQCDRGTYRHTFGTFTAAIDTLGVAVTHDTFTTGSNRQCIGLCRRDECCCHCMASIHRRGAQTCATTITAPTGKQATASCCSSQAHGGTRIKIKRTYGTAIDAIAIHGARATP